MSRAKRRQPIDAFQAELARLDRELEGVMRSSEGTMPGLLDRWLAFAGLPDLTAIVAGVDRIDRIWRIRGSERSFRICPGSRSLLVFTRVPAATRSATVSWRNEHVSAGRSSEA